jgi:hypothetical protein
MVPEFVPEIFHVLQMGIKESHQFNHRIRIALADLLVLKRQQVLNHLLNMSPIFSHDEMISCCVVFHVLHVKHSTKVMK